MADLILPPDYDTEHRANILRWHKLRYETDLECNAPNYPKWLGGIFAGLLQALPPQVTPATLTAQVDPADLLDDGGSDAAALGAVFLRPVWDGSAWTIGIVHPSQVLAVWAHKRLVEALVWSIFPDPTNDDDRKTWAILERWNNTTGQVVVERWAGEMTNADSAGTARFTGTRELSEAPDGFEDHPMFAESEMDGTERYLVAVVHDWENGHPAPVYAQNEGLLSGLTGLADQEQDDAEMVRNRIAMPRNMVGRQQIIAADGVTIIADAGFKKNDSLLVTEPGLTAQEQAGLVHPIIFPDHLTQRERIERRENTLLEACGISPQSIGRNVTGRSDSGAAKRADNQMTMQTVAAPARRWSKALSEVYTQLARLSGMGQRRRQAVEVKVTPGLRLTIDEAAEAAEKMLQGQSGSFETRVRTVHPDWSDTQVNEEVERVTTEFAGQVF